MVAAGAAQDVAQPQVGDAGAAQLAQTRERRGVRRGASSRSTPVAGALERRALVRRAQEHEVVDARRASAGRLAVSAVVQRAARHQAAHAVAEHHQPLDRHRPGVVQPLHQLRQDAPLVETLQAAVVVQVDRRVAELAAPTRRRGRARRAATAGRSCTGRAPARAVAASHRAARDRSPKRSSDNARPARRNAHRDRQRVVGGRQVVAQHAVERGHDRFALGMGRLARVGRRSAQAPANRATPRRRRPRHA